jgi:hypothetical protein
MFERDIILPDIFHWVQTRKIAMIDLLRKKKKTPFIDCRVLIFAKICYSEVYKICFQYHINIEDQTYW